MATLYECMFILQPTLTDEEVAQVVELATGILTGGGGEVVSTELLGRRRLAYQIDENTEGIYGLIYFHSNQETIEDLRHEFQLSTEVIRAMVVCANERAMALRATAAADAESEEAPADAEGTEAPEAAEAAPVVEAEPEAEPAPEPAVEEAPAAEEDAPAEPAA